MIAPSLIRFGSLALMLSGCFAELTTDLSPDPTVEHSCTPGAVGCECYGNGTCDTELDCVAELGTCVPSGCAAGSAQCVCDAGDCQGELVCSEGLCLEPAGESSSSTDPGSESGTPDGDAGSTGAGPTTSASTGSESTGAPSESSSDATGQPETGTMECSALACGECVGCVAEPDGVCSSQAGACTDELGCDSAAVCLESCGVKGLCLDECCADKSDAAANAAIALNACRADACAAACDDYNVGLCS